MGYVRQVPERHYCRPPDPFGTQDDYEFPRSESGGLHPPKLKAGVKLPRVGDIWECDECGRRWKLNPSPYINVLTPIWVEVQKLRRICKTLLRRISLGSKDDGPRKERT